MITPLQGRDQLDHPGLERLVEHILGGGVTGLFILGTSGEGPGLSYRLRRELIDRVTHQVAGRRPVLVGITDTSFTECVSLSRYAAERGAQALVLATPYYFPSNQDELSGYLERLIPELPLPVLLYNMPQMTKVPFAVETVRRATALPGVIGVKDSGGDLEYFKQILTLRRERPDWSFLIGPEERLLDALRAGGDGGVSGGANVFPRLYVQLCEAAFAGDAVRAERLQAAILRVSEALYRIGRHSSPVITGIKGALRCLGVCSDFMAEPFERFPEGERDVVRARVAELQADLAALNVQTSHAETR